MNKMRMGIIRLYCGESGQANYYNMQEIGLAKEYVKNGYVVYIIILKKGNLKEYYEKIDENIRFIFPVTFHILNHGLFALNVLKRLRLNLVHLNSDNQLFVPAVLSYCKKNDIEVYNYVGMLFSGARSKGKKLLSDFSTRINLTYYNRYPTIAKTDEIRKEMENRGINNICVVPVGLDIEIIPKNNYSKEYLRKNLELPVDKKIILFIGRMQEEKRPLDMLELLKNLEDEYILVMIGEGRLTCIIDEKIQSLGLSNRVYRIHKIENNKIHKYYLCADFFINLCRNEPFGMCILEAMYNRCLVIAIKAPGPNMLIINGITGFLSDNMDEIKLILEGQIENKKNMLDRAYEEVCSKYLWKYSYKKIEEFREEYRMQ